MVCFTSFTECMLPVEQCPCLTRLVQLLPTENVTNITGHLQILQNVTDITIELLPRKRKCNKCNFHLETENVREQTNCNLGLQPGRCNSQMQNTRKIQKKQNTAKCKYKIQQKIQNNERKQMAILVTARAAPIARLGGIRNTKY